jgi:hypothetical protein
MGIALHGLVSVALAAGTWIVGNSVATGDQDNVAVANNGSGYTALVWEDDRDGADPADDNHTEVYVRVWKDGVAVYEKKLSAGGTGNWRHLSPDVGLDAKGNAVVAWAEDADGNGYYNIQVRVLGPTGTQLGSVRANASADGQQTQPSVAVDPDGTPSSFSAVAYTVAWQDTTTAGLTTVRVAGFSAATTKLYEAQAGPATGTNRLPDVATDAAGNAYVVWEEDKDGNGFYNIGLTKLSRTGAVTLVTTTANVDGTDQQLKPSVAATFNGDFAVAWQDNRTLTARTYVRGFTPAGVGLYADVQASTLDLTVAQTAPSIGIDDQRGIVVGWTQADDVWAAGFGPTGSNAGRLPAGRQNTTFDGLQTGMVTAVNQWGEVAFGYTDDTDLNGADQTRLGLDFTNSTW